MKKSQLREAIRTIVRSKLNEINGLGAVSNADGTLTATLYNGGLIKLSIYTTGGGAMPDSKLIASPAAVDSPDFNYEYIKNQIRKSGSEGISDESIQNLLNRVKSTLLPKLNEGPDGLWKNIRDKRERGEKPARKGSEAYKTAVQAGKRINSEK
jgi:hypothetical protein